MDRHAFWLDQRSFDLPEDHERHLTGFIRREVAVMSSDDIVIFSRSKEEHEGHLRQGLKCLEESELYAKPSKGTIGVRELECCGHLVGDGVTKPVPAKVEVISEWPQPRNAHEVRQFLGLAFHHGRCIRHFARMAAPSSDLLVEADEARRKKDFHPIAWNALCEDAFQSLKHAMTSSPVSQQIDESQEFRIATDCSEWALGCVLSQLGPDGKWHPVAFDGRNFVGLN